MGSRLTVLVDADEVIFDLVSEWLDVYARFGGERLTREDIVDYAMVTQVKNPELLFKAIDKGPGLRNAKPFPGAIDALRRLNDKHDTYVVTYARHESFGRAHEYKLAAFWEHAPWFDRDRVIFTRQKHLVRGHYLVEDSPANLGRWYHDNMGRGFLIDQPWNRQVTDRDLACVCSRRVTSLAEVADELCGVEG